MTDTPTEPAGEWWEYDVVDECDLGWVTTWLDAVRDTICECLEDCGIPVPETKCVSMCPPSNDGALAANGCCQRIDVWRGATVTRFTDQSCDTPVPTLQITARILRCRVNWKSCSPEQADSINAAIAREQVVLAEKVPGKLSSQDCCNGGLVAGNVTVTPVCDPCVGSQVTFTLSRPT